MGPLPTCSTAVVSLAVRGDRLAFAELYAMHWRQVYGLALKILDDPLDAEDIAQETFARALVAIGDYDERGLPIGAWLCRIARHACIDEIRARQRGPVGGIPLGYRWRDRDFEQADARIDMHLSVRHTIRRMPDDWRTVLRLKFGGATNDEIAAAMGRSEGAVKALYFRCLTTLQEHAA